MFTLCHSAKGGSGTTVVTTLAALAHRGPTLLLDLDDEAPLVLGVADAERPGVADWLDSDAPLDHLDDLVVEVDDSTWLLPTRSAGNDARSFGLPLDDLGRWMQLASWSRSWAARHDGVVLVDAGTQRVPAPFVAACDHRWLVTRSCYLSVRSASTSTVESTGVVVVREPGRALGDDDIARSVRAPVIASLTWDPSIARSVDAGLVSVSRVHRSTARTLDRLVRDVARRTAVLAA